MEVTKKEYGMGGEYVKKEIRIKDITSDILGKGIKEGKDVETVKKMLFEVETLIESLSEGNLENAEKSIERLGHLGEKRIFDEVGKITRKLHDSLKEFRNALDPKIKALAVKEMPEAVDSLEQVIVMTENAANRTLGLVEKGMASQEEFKRRIEKFSSLLNTVFSSDPEFHKEAYEFINYLYSINNETTVDLTQILVSQDFQDLTGQVIKRVIKLVHDLEDQLVKLIKKFGIELTPVAEKKEAGLKGPAGMEKVDQKGINDLLSSFGF